jgi:hypothetical protein
MKKITTALLSIAALGCSAPAFADDVNRTGQTQSNDAGKPGTAAKDGSADNMGGGNSSSTGPTQQPQKAPSDATKPVPGTPDTNDEPDAVGGNKK